MIVNTTRVVFLGLTAEGAARIVVQADRFAVESPAAWDEMQAYRVDLVPRPVEFNDGVTAFFEFSSLAQLQTLAAKHGLWAPDPTE